MIDISVLAYDLEDLLERLQRIYKVHGNLPIYSSNLLEDEVNANENCEIGIKFHITDVIDDNETTKSLVIVQ